MPNWSQLFLLDFGVFLDLLLNCKDFLNEPIAFVLQSDHFLVQEQWKLKTLTIKLSILLDWSETFVFWNDFIIILLTVFSAVNFQFHVLIFVFWWLSDGIEFEMKSIFCMGLLFGA